MISFLTGSLVELQQIQKRGLNFYIYFDIIILFFNKTNKFENICHDYMGTFLFIMLRALKIFLLIFTPVSCTSCAFETIH